MFSVIEGTGYEVIDERFAACFVGNSRVERLWTGGRWCEGPAWFAAGRYLVWSDIPNDRMMRFDETDGSVSVFRQPADNSNGNTVDLQGRLITCHHLSRRVTRTEHDGSITIIADRFEGKRFNSPNDAVVKSDGSIWFTDPPYGIPFRRLMLGVFRRFASRVQDQTAASLAASGVYWLILVATVAVAVDALDLPVLRRWMGAVATHLPRFVIAGALVVGGVVLARLASNAIVKAGSRFPAAQSRRLARLTRVAIIVAATLIAAAQLGLDVSLVTSFFLIAWAAALGAAALAFGLGAREVIANILAMHYVTQSFRVGQRVRVGPDEGRVVRTTRPGRDFIGSRCVLLSAESGHGS